MLSKIKSFGLIGINGYEITVEIDIKNGLPGYDIVGLGDTAIKESKERVNSAIKNSNFTFPIRKVVVNLAPSSIKKEGSFFDLAIALGILCASEQLNQASVNNFAVLGELALNGDIRRIDGLLPILISAREKGFNKFIIPFANRVEASFISGLEIYAVKNLRECVDFLQGMIVIDKLTTSDFETLKNSEVITNDFCYVKGQYTAKRALEIAAAGGHNVLLIGPPGSGKTMMARCFSSILPDLTFDEALEITKIHSVSGILDIDKGIVTSRPFRAPHHTASLVALTGGGRNSKPGEISLAHNGVLFLDEMPEYSRNAIESFRQPLEDGTITVARANQTIDYPANFTLVASMNPCPCGYFGSKKVQCKCTPSIIHKYLNKLSGPIMDRIDMHIEVDNVEYADLKSTKLEESSSEIKKRVDNARNIQRQRFANSKCHSNSSMNTQQCKKYCTLSKDCENLLKEAFDKLNLTARAYTRILKVARTIADLENSETITIEHIAEAISYRSLDEKYWR